MKTTIEQAKKIAEQKTGYSYNPATLEAICNAGYDAIRDGTILTTQGDQKLVKQGADVVCVKGGAETKRMPIGDKKDYMLMETLEQKIKHWKKLKG